MILELLALSAGVSVVTALLVRRKSRAASAQKGASARAPDATTRAAKKTSTRTRDAASTTASAKARGGASAKTRDAMSAAASTEPRGLRIADVVLYADTELWLAGALHLEEDGFVMRVFRTPGSSRADWLVQLDDAGEDVALCRVTVEVPAGHVPEALPIGGQRLVLRRRGHAKVRSEGSDVPRGMSRSRYIELRGPGGRTLVVLDFDGGERLALLGDRVGSELLDVLPGGDLERSADDA